ncbi:MAG TPA: type I restriction-modification system subunit M N-terminal domain-containing protein, partial [Candidatus Dojkabacteria bacterium]|nr:type I restriction-modification system subunit M N-terminal domain-containing protein [Candidatus Dojkabacteria bacterium]
MADEHKQLLEKQLWSVANILRGKMNADEYKNYILGFIFYKYLSEKLSAYVDEELLKGEKYKFDEIDEETQEGEKILEAVQKATTEYL